MIQTKFKFTHAIAVVLLSLCIPLTAFAQAFYPAMGKISTLTPETIILGDMQYRLSPTVKITLLKNKKGQLSDLKVGDFVGATITTINKRRLIDSLTVLKNPGRR